MIAERRHRPRGATRVPSVRTRLTTVLVVLVGLLLMVGLTGLFLFDLATARSERLALGLTPAHDVNDQVGLVLDTLEAGGPVAEGCRDLRTALDEIDALVADPALASLNATQRQAVQRYCQRLSVEDSPTTRAVGAELSTAHAAVGAWIQEQRLQARLEIGAIRRNGLAGLAALSLVATALAAFGAQRTVLAMDLPLRGLVDVLNRQRDGAQEARAELSGPLEVQQVARALNALADETAVLRERQLARLELKRRTHDAARRVRAELEAEQVLRAAASAIGAMLDPDEVWLRTMGETGRIASWPTPDRPAMPPWLRTGSGCWHAAIEAAEGPIGEVWIVPGERGRLGEDELDAVETIGREVAQALAQSSLFSTQAQLVDELQALDRQKDDFVSTVSHELRTPLASVRGYTELLLDEDAGPITAAQRSMLEVVERNTSRLSGLIENLLTFTRPEPDTLRLQPVRLAPVIEAVVATLRPELAGVQLRVRGGAESRVVAEAGQLERALLNVVANAVKFTAAPGIVSIEVDDDHTATTIRVIDTGIGIPADDLDRLFTTFFRASNAVDAAVPGTGLGLVIVRGIMQAFGGSVTVTSVLDEGTTVELTLPTAPTDQLSFSTSNEWTTTTPSP